MYKVALCDIFFKRMRVYKSCALFLPRATTSRVACTRARSSLILTRRRPPSSWRRSGWGRRTRSLSSTTSWLRATPCRVSSTSSMPPAPSWWASAWRWKRASSTAATPSGSRATTSTLWPLSRRLRPTTSPSGRMIRYEKGFSAGLRRPV